MVLAGLRAHDLEEGAAGVLGAGIVDAFEGVKVGKHDLSWANSDDGA